MLFSLRAQHNKRPRLWLWSLAWALLSVGCTGIQLQSHWIIQDLSWLCACLGGHNHILTNILKSLESTDCEPRSCYSQNSLQNILHQMARGLSDLQGIAKPELTLYLILNRGKHREYKNFHIFFHLHVALQRQGAVPKETSEGLQNSATFLLSSTHRSVLLHLY